MRANRGGLVDEVRAFYAQDSRSKEMIKHLLLIKDYDITSKFPPIHSL